MPNTEGSSACACPRMISSTSMPTSALCCQRQSRTQGPCQHLFPWRLFWGSPECRVKKHTGMNKQTLKIYKKTEAQEELLSEDYFWIMHLLIPPSLVHLHCLLLLSLLFLSLLLLLSLLLHPHLLFLSLLLCHLLLLFLLFPLFILFLSLQGSLLFRLWLKLLIETSKEFPSTGCTKTFDRPSQIHANAHMIVCMCKSLMTNTFANLWMYRLTWKTKSKGWRTLETEMFKTTKEMFLHYMFLRQATLAQIDTNTEFMMSRKNRKYKHTTISVLLRFLFS